MRTPVAAVLASVVAAALGAVILGEYELAGVRPLLAGVIFGIAVAEIMATVSGPVGSDLRLPAASSVIVVAGLVWATWISTGHELGLASTSAWCGVLIGGVAAPLWLRNGGRRGGRNPTGPGPSPDG